MDGIEADMLHGLAPDTLVAMRIALSACARSLEAAESSSPSRLTPDRDRRSP